jgi:hypothetical protein
MAVGLLDTRFLNSARLDRIVTTLASQLEMERPLIYVNRLDMVDAEDDEIMGRFVGNVVAADIIADDQQAVVQESGKLELVTTQIPNVKLGQRIGQGKLNLMERLNRFGGLARDDEAYRTWEQRFAENLVTGVRQRLNFLACAMMLDLANYNRFGVVLTNASWGMPANLKVTPATAWSNVAAVPIDDILGMNVLASQNYYNVAYDRATMSTQAFQYLVKTTQFANEASLTLNAGFLVSPSAIAGQDVRRNQNLLGRILNMEIEIDDATFAERNNAGALARSRYLPANKVLLSRTQDDNDPAVWDIGNAVVTESVVAGLRGEFGGMLGANPFAGGRTGPVGYYTGREDLNPPDLVGWAVARAFPRKMIPEVTAVLTVFP